MCHLTCIASVMDVCHDGLLTVDWWQRARTLQKAFESLRAKMALADTYTATATGARARARGGGGGGGGAGAGGAGGGGVMRASNM